MESEVHVVAFSIAEHNLRIGSYGKDRRRWRPYFLIADLEKDVTRTQPGNVSGTAFVYILKHPALFSVEHASHESGADREASWNIWATGVSEAGVTRF